MPIVPVFKEDGSIHICGDYKQTVGVHSASGIFQRVLENRLASIPYVKVRSDILISGKNDIEHFNSLKNVLKIIYDNSLCLKLQKCVLMQNEFVYLGFKINRNEIFSAKQKIGAIKNAEQLKFSELKSFWGLLNYYHRQFQGFVDTIEPLHNLLFEKTKTILDEKNFLIHYDPEKTFAASFSCFAVWSWGCFITPNARWQSESHHFCFWDTF